MISPFPKGIAPSVTAFIASSRRASGHEGPSREVCDRITDGKNFAGPAFRREPLQFFETRRCEAPYQPGVGCLASGRSSDPSSALDLSLHRVEPLYAAANRIGSPQSQRVSTYH